MFAHICLKCVHLFVAIANLQYWITWEQPECVVSRFTGNIIKCRFLLRNARRLGILPLFTDISSSFRFPIVNCIWFEIRPTWVILNTSAISVIYFDFSSRHFRYAPAGNCWAGFACEWCLVKQRPKYKNKSITITCSHLFVLLVIDFKWRQRPLSQKWHYVKNDELTNNFVQVIKSITQMCCTFYLDQPFGTIRSDEKHKSCGDFSTSLICHTT